jgi:methionyl-tRNA formyltransferase
MSRPLRLAFMGTPVLARTILARLADLAGPDWSVVGVVAQPDKPSGRNLQLQPPPVKVEAMARGFPILQPERARDLGFIEAIREWSPDIIVVAAYGQILPQALLDVPPHGCINVHTSLLPRWRGAAPIQWAIAEGDPETGVCLMRMEAGLDTGPVLATARTPIHADDTGSTLHDRLANLGAELVVQGLPGIASGQLQPVPQPAEGVTYARKISREDGRIDWNQPGEVIARRARAFSPWPGSFCTFASPNGQGFSILKVHAMDVVHGQPGAAGEVVASSKDGTVVACARDAIRLVEVQPEGGRRMPAHAFMAGHAVLRFQ